MKELLNELCERYNPNKYQFDNPENLEFGTKNEIPYTIDISLVKNNNDYYIFLYISEENDLKYKGVLIKSNELLKMEYDKIYNDLTNLSLCDFLNKYSKTLKN